MGSRPHFSINVHFWGIKNVTYWKMWYLRRKRCIIGTNSAQKAKMCSQPHNSFFFFFLVRYPYPLIMGHVLSILSIKRVYNIEYCIYEDALYDNAYFVCVFSKCWGVIIFPAFWDCVYLNCNHVVYRRKILMNLCHLPIMGHFLTKSNFARFEVETGHKTPQNTENGVKTFLKWHF